MKGDTTQCYEVYYKNVYPGIGVAQFNYICSDPPVYLDIIVGSVLGAAGLIGIVGLIYVLWAKREDIKNIRKLFSTGSNGSQ